VIQSKAAIGVGWSNGLFALTTALRSRKCSEGGSSTSRGKGSCPNVADVFAAARTGSFHQPLIVLLRKPDGDHMVPRVTRLKCVRRFAMAER
jgi:hypothetical protein